MRVGATVVAATSSAGASSVKTIAGSRASSAWRSDGSAARAGVVVRTMRPMLADGVSGTCRCARGDSPTDRTL